MDKQDEGIGGPPILEVRDITKRFTGVVALEGVSVAFAAGEVEVDEAGEVLAEQAHHEAPHCIAARKDS